MINIITLALITAFAVAINIIFTPFLIRFSHKHKLYDETNSRKIHSGDMPRIGGIGIFLSFTISIFALVIINKYSGTSLNEISKYRHIALASGFFIITAMGAADDFIDIRAWHKFLIQTLVALIVSIGGFNFGYFHVPFIQYNLPLGVFTHILTVFWIITVCNAVNLMDGLDGLAGGIAVITSLFYGIIFYSIGNYTAAAFSFCLLGASAGFLIFNLPPAKIFMGDSGSLFLGFSLAVIPLINNVKPVTSQVVFIPLIILVIPLLDIIAAILRRRRRKLPISSPDREHVHHKLLDFGLSGKKILFVIYSFSAAAGLAGLLFSRISSDAGFLLAAGIWAVYTALFIILHYKNQARKKAASTK